MLRFLIPKIHLRLIPRMLGFAVMGALIAGVYGMLHDQVTYTISPEYFTRLKFDQFRDADFGLHPRLFVAIIGFLATWWVGLFSGWFIARAAVPKLPPAAANKMILRGFTILLGSAFVFGLAGYLIGRLPAVSTPYWQDACLALGVRDVRAFVTVAFIHYGSYLGGIIGLIAVLFRMRISLRRLRGE